MTSAGAGLFRRASLAIAKRVPVRPVRSRLTRAIASITFDDAAASATRLGASILEEAGLAATYYICGAHTGGAFEGQAQHTLGDLARLAEAGHEIGCHGYAHRDATRTDRLGLTADHEANRAFLRRTVGVAKIESFAFPYGATSVRAKRFYSRRFEACRGVLGGINAGWVDLAELRAFLLTPGRSEARRLERLVEKARARAGWLIFFTHDVSPDPSPFGCRREDLERIVETLARAGVDVLPVREAARRLVLGETAAP